MKKRSFKKGVGLIFEISNILGTIYNKLMIWGLVMWKNIGSDGRGAVKIGVCGLIIDGRERKPMAIIF